uniref:Heat shock 70 kDa protein cognate 3-like n=1 Tax=Saccoglossus kowalevskii TaxID=10224 RepID=A0ABM0MT79_SACKO
DLFRSTLKPVQSVIDDSGLQKQDINEIVLIGGSTRIPKIQQLVRDFFGGKEPSRGINPDEAVAYGAAVQGGILAGETWTRAIEVLDITSLALGFEIVGGELTELIPKNTRIPTKKSKFFFLDKFRPSVTIRVFEGERPMTKYGQPFSVLDVGVAQVDVIFK